MSETPKDRPAAEPSDAAEARGAPAYAGARGFLRRPLTRDLAGADVAVLGVPFDLATTNRPGARFGPAAIRQASAQIAWGEAWPWGFDPLERLAVVDRGDVAFELGDTADMLARVEAAAGEVLAAGAALLALGGDHLVTLALLRAHAKAHGPLALIHFDAHSDTGRRERLDHGSMFHHARREGLIVPEASVQVGVRTAYEPADAFHVLEAPHVRRAGPEATAAEIARLVDTRPAYLTFDVDCLDPAYAPGTGTPVVGGLSTGLVLDILRGLAGAGGERGLDILAMDVMEVAPAYDAGEITALAAATLGLEFLAMKAGKAEKRSAR